MSSMRTNYEGNFARSANLVKHNTRAVFYPSADGKERLARVQHFSSPLFLESGYEMHDSDKNDKKCKEYLCKNAKNVDNVENINRAVRRAQVTVFDLLMCNPDLDAFLTLTFSPEEVADRSDYSAIYPPLRAWLSNRVQRNGLKYIMIPERHKKGGIHLHALANSGALKFARATSPRTNLPLNHNGRAVYNVTDWRHGFTTAELLPADDLDHIRAAKYCFKYMGKEAGAKIGGRYFLHGGDFVLPRYAYADDPSVFLGENYDAREAGFTKYAKVAGGGVEYAEWSLI